MLTSKIKLPFKIASFHDVHLGHRRTETKHIIKNLNDVFKDVAEVSTWDMLVFPGDLFDRLLFLPDPNLNDIISLFRCILDKANRYGFSIRILKGTPGHDYDQSQLFIDVANALEGFYNVDIKYIKELEIEYIEKYNLNMLYVPDEWRHDVMETYNEAKELIQARGLYKVDFCLFHGAFNYQINAKLNPKAHNEELWSDLVNYYILAGHVHYKSQYKNILVAGSFDRLNHGEEESKGWVTCEIREDEDEIIFHENKGAMIYHTLDIRGLTLEEVFQTINEKCMRFPEYSHIRLFITSKDEIADGLKEIKRKFSHFYFTTKVEKVEDEKVQQTLQIVSEKFKPIELNRDNICRIVEERLNNLEIDTQQVLTLLQRYL